MNEEKLEVEMAKSKVYSEELNRKLAESEKYAAALLKIVKTYEALEEDAKGEDAEPQHKALLELFKYGKLLEKVIEHPLYTESYDCDVKIYLRRINEQLDIRKKEMDRFNILGLPLQFASAFNKQINKLFPPKKE